MCGRCDVMEEAFFKTYWENRVFKEAFMATLEAGMEYDRTRHDDSEPEQSEDEAARIAAQMEVKAQVSEVGWQAALAGYADKFTSRLDQEHQTLLEMTDRLIQATLETYGQHNENKIKTTLEVGNRLAAMSMNSGTETLYLVLFGTLLTELAACPEARELLAAQRTVPGVEI